MAVPPAPQSWSETLLDQFRFHWDVHLRPRLADLSDDEYFWEPVAGMWSVRQRGDARTELVGGSGDMVLEWVFPEPDPAPMTTIAWRLAHLVCQVFGERNANHFGGPPTGFFAHDFAATAAVALAQLDQAVDYWCEGVAAMSDEDLGQPVGDAEGPFAAHPYRGLVLHVHREAIHHGAEILLLRELRAHQG